MHCIELGAASLWYRCGGTDIRAMRFDWKNESKPLEKETKEQHDAWLEVWSQIELSGLYGFPVWEREVHDILQVCGAAQPVSTARHHIS